MTFETLPRHLSDKASLEEVLDRCGILKGDSAAPIIVTPPVSTTCEVDAKIMIVDDEPVNIKVVRKYLKIAGYSRFVETNCPRSALALIRDEDPDILLLDIMMPDVNGLDILRSLRSSESGTDLPVLILTAMDDPRAKAGALVAGATDFLKKPVDASELVARVRNAVRIKRQQDSLRNQALELERLVRIRTAELAQSRLEVIYCLGRAAEFRDNDTGRHVVRVGRYSAIIAEEMGLDRETVELIEHSAPLHDVGKIGIPDSILLKPGRLEPDEFEVIKRHCVYGDKIVGHREESESPQSSSHTEVGARIMNLSSSPILQMATRIAMTHHEKWDGSGYPHGLSGCEIPIEGRITAVADVFDALSNKRCYKEAFPLDQSFRMIEEGRGSHFDPAVVDAFLARRDEVTATMKRLSDDC